MPSMLVQPAVFKVAASAGDLVVVNLQRLIEIVDQRNLTVRGVDLERHHGRAWGRVGTEQEIVRHLGFGQGVVVNPELVKVPAKIRVDGPIRATKPVVHIIEIRQLVGRGKWIGLGLAGQLGASTPLI